MTRFRCLACNFKMMARRRPKACPRCGKTTHEDDLRKKTWTTPVIELAEKPTGPMPGLPASAFKQEYLEPRLVIVDDPGPRAAELMRQTLIPRCAHDTIIIDDLRTLPDDVFKPLKEK